MVAEIKTYTPEQMHSLHQFKRAQGILASLKEHEEMIQKGGSAFGTDPFTKLSFVFDKGSIKILKGALYGMWNEATDLGLKEELKP